jgi:hypothetical protein
VSKIKVVWLHEFVQKVRKEYEASSDPLCFCATAVYGIGADDAMGALIEERFPGVGYCFLPGMQREENERLGLEFHVDWRQCRLEFLARLLEQPDRRICWMER